MSEERSITTLSDLSWGVVILFLIIWTIAVTATAWNIKQNEQIKNLQHRIAVLEQAKQ